jgi:hypothetical protein
MDKKKNPGRTQRVDEMMMNPLTRRASLPAVATPSS